MNGSSAAQCSVGFDAGCDRGSALQLRAGAMGGPGISVYGPDQCGARYVPPPTTITVPLGRTHGVGVGFTARHNTLPPLAFSTGSHGPNGLVLLCSRTLK